MKKRIATLTLLTLFALFYGCNKQPDNTNKSYTNEKIYTITIPESYFIFSGADPTEAAEAYNELGDEYCTEAMVSGNDMIVKVTDKQRKNLIKRNNDFMDELVAPLLDADPLYKYYGSDEFTEISFYIDEKVPRNIHAQGVFGLVAGYGLNYILQNNSTDWTVHLTIYNCHTGNKVIEGSIPQDSITYGPEEWEKSYE